MPECTLTLTDWTASRGCEPRIRVGIVLPTDGVRMVRVDVPPGLAALLVDRREMPCPPAGSWAVHAENGQVRLVAPSLDSGIAGDVIALTVRDSAYDQPGTGFRLHDVLTGRGFHWQKRVSFTLPGELEFRADGDCILATNVVGLEQYLPGVITAEMSGECPLEFLKSQCVVARSWVLAHTEAKHTEWPIDRCNDDCCQRYHGTTNLTPRAVQAVTATRGQVVTDAAARIIDANYSKSCGGIIEAPEHVWFTAKPCQRAAVDAPAGSPSQRFLPVAPANLKEFLTGDWLADTDVFCSPNVVPDGDLPRYLGSVDEGGGHFRWRVEYTREQLESLLRARLGSVFGADAPAAPASQPILVADLPPRRMGVRVPPIHRLCDLRVTQRGLSGRARELEIDYEDPARRRRTLRVRSEYRIREILHERFLYSSAFDIEVERTSTGVPSRFVLVGAGWGHGAGLCQIGALGMAISGYSCPEILGHYFEGVQLRTLY